MALETIQDTIKLLVINGELSEPFSVADVRRVCDILKNSPSYLSKHCTDNPKGKYAAYFQRVSRGKYQIVKIG